MYQILSEWPSFIDDITRNILVSLFSGYNVVVENSRCADDLPLYAGLHVITLRTCVVRLYRL